MKLQLGKGSLGVLMLTWFVFTTSDQMDVERFLDQLGDKAGTAKVAETWQGRVLHYDVFYNTSQPIQLNHYSKGPDQ